MTRENVSSAKIECRHGSGYPVYNITAFFRRKDPSEKADYGNLVAMAKQMLMETMHLTAKDGWYAYKADVLAWSSVDEKDSMGILCPTDYRVTLDMMNKKDKKHEEDEEA